MPFRFVISTFERRRARALRLCPQLAFVAALPLACASRQAQTVDSTAPAPRPGAPVAARAPEPTTAISSSAPSQPPEEHKPAEPQSSDTQTAPVGMLFVPGGTFTMGADSGGEEDEHPAHSVTIDGFWLDINEVTVHDYTECVSSGVCAMYRTDVAQSLHAGDDDRFRKPDQPVSGISWEQAKTYCEYRGKRLPREAEWERAARGDDNRKYPWGDSAPDARVHGCFGRALGTPDGVTCKVGSYPAGAGPYGHLDLAGNVWEWLSDYYDPFAYRRPTANRGEPGTCEQIRDTQDWLRSQNRRGFTGTNPIPTDCERVLRGGAFNYPAAGLRVTNRVHHPATWRLLMAGVRCARDNEGDNNGHRSATMTNP